MTAHDEQTPHTRRDVAVALHYEHGGVPRVTAKGHGEVARRIVETAEASGVTVDENEMLAEALSGIELGEEIPEDLYRAVAVVISYALRVKDRAGALE
jgi:flagellar biosynthesis protein